MSLVPTSGWAQQPVLPYQESHIEPDQELNPVGGATDAFKAIHRISAARLQGVRGKNGLLYWVDQDGKRLSAYQGKTLLWQTQVAKAFQGDMTQPQITALVLSAEVLFIQVTGNGFAEINRQTGVLCCKVIYPDE